MKNLNELKNDKSGLNTILVIAAVVIILAAAGAAAFFVLSNNDGGKSNDGNSYKEGWVLAPGSVLTYDLTSEGEETTVFKCTVVGEGPDNFFVKGEYVGEDWGDGYFTFQKTAPDGANSSKKTMKTINGNKSLDVYETIIPANPSLGEQIIKQYVDPKTGITYLEEYTSAYYTANGTETLSTALTLTKLEPVWQDPSTIVYPDSIGTSFTYNPVKPYPVSIGSTTLYALPINIVCVAGLSGGSFGISFDGYRNTDDMLMYYCSNSPQGLPIGAEPTTKTLTESTIDGVKNMQVWTHPDFDDYEFYVDAQSGVIYKIVYDRLPFYDKDELVVYKLTKKTVP